MTKRSRGILRWVLGGIVVVLIAVVVTVSLVAGRYITAFDNFLNKVTVGEAMNPGAEEVSLMDEPFIVYISGSDSRGSIDDAARSDVNIVAVVNAIEGKVLLVSIPRDAYVQLHGTEGLRDKLTHAGVYGIEMSKATVEDFLGVKIGYTMKVGFDTVVKIVDQIDGIEIYSDTAMSLGAEGKDKTCNFVVGTQVVDGDCALRFARERKSYETGDRHRGENQEAVIVAIIAKMTGSQDYLLKVPEILDIAGESLRTSFTKSDVTDMLRWQLLERTKWEVEKYNIDGTGAMEPTYSMGADRPLYVMYADEATVVEAKAKIAEYLMTEETESVALDKPNGPEATIDESSK